MAKSKKASSKRTTDENLVPQLTLGFIPNDEVAPLDKLGRSGFSQGIYKLIKAVPNARCAVVGVEGAWGSGKSFVLEQIRHLNKDDAETNTRWMVFSPWNFEGRQHLISIYLNELAKFIDRIEPKPKWRKYLRHFNGWIAKAERILRLFVKAHTGISLLLVATYTLITYAFYGMNALMIHLGLVVSTLGTLKITLDSFKDLPSYLEGLADNLRAYAELTKNSDNSNDGDLNRLKARIHDKLIKCKHFDKLIICIEDIDRLAPEEVRAVMQLVRGVADFPRIVYLLGYDRDHVVNCLQQLSPQVPSDATQDKSYGEGYLQKVTDAAFSLPIPDPTNAANLILGKWDVNAKLYYGEDYQKQAYWELNFGYLYALLNDNLRDFERVCNRATLMLLLLGRRSNPLDVLFCAYLQEFEPKVWRWFRLNGVESIAQGERWFNGERNGSVDFNAPRYGILVDQISNTHRKFEIKQLLQAIVPYYGYSGSRLLKSKDRDLFRFADPDIMPFYLRYEIGTIAEIQDLIPDIVKNDAKRQSYIDRIINRGGDDTFVLIRNLSELYDEGQIPQDKIDKLLIALGKALDNNANRANHFGKSYAHEIYWLTVEWINKTPEAQRASIFVKIIINWLNQGAMYLPIVLTEKIGLEMGWVALDEKQRLSQSPLHVKLSKTQIKTLRDALNSTVAQWNHENPPKWFNHQYCASMLFSWLRINKESARAMLDEWVKDDYKFMYLLQCMVMPVYRNDIAFERISPHGLSYLTGLSRDQIIQRVQAVSGNIHLVDKFEKVIALVDELPDPLPDEATAPQFE